MDGSTEIVSQRIYAYNECMSQWLYCIYPWLGGKHNIAERARHPEDVLRSGGALKLDVEWYLALQVCNHCNVYVNPYPNPKLTLTLTNRQTDSSLEVRSALLLLL